MRNLIQILVVTALFLSPFSLAFANPLTVQEQAEADALKKSLQGFIAQERSKLGKVYCEDVKVYSFEEWADLMSQKTIEEAKRNGDISSRPRPKPRPGYMNPKFSNAGLTPDFYEGHATCEIFIKPDGSYGSTGETIANYLNLEQGPFEDLISDKTAALPSIKKVCPGFAQMNRKDRIHTMVWLVAAIAWDETKCGANLVNPDNLEATGLLQMNNKEADRKWRGFFCEGKTMNPIPSAADPHGVNVLCAMDILQGQFRGKYGEPGLYPDSYFEKLRGKIDFQENTIIKRIMQAPGCF